MGTAMIDLDLEIAEDTDLSIVTSRDEDSLALLRHDAAHVMARLLDSIPKRR